jgi:hypothetical protein
MSDSGYMGRKSKQVSPATFVNTATKFQIAYEQGICLRPEKLGNAERNT